MTGHQLGNLVVKVLWASAHAVGLVVILVILYLIYNEYLRYTSRIKNLPGPPGAPIVGNLLQQVSRHHELTK